MNLFLGRKYHCPLEFVLRIFPNFIHGQILEAHCILYNFLDFWRCCKFRMSGLVSVPAQGFILAGNTFTHTRLPPSLESSLIWNGRWDCKLLVICLQEYGTVISWRYLLFPLEKLPPRIIFKVIFISQYLNAKYVCHLINSEASKTLHSRLWSLDQKT